MNISDGKETFREKQCLTSRCFFVTENFDVILSTQLSMWRTVIVFLCSTAFQITVSSMNIAIFETPSRQGNIMSLGSSSSSSVFLKYLSSYFKKRRILQS